jgi:hypothetical protein
MASSFRDGSAGWQMPRASHQPWVKLHNIKVGAVLAYQASILGLVRLMFLLLWTPLDLGPLGRRLVGITSRARFHCALEQVVSEPKVGQNL